MSPKAKRNQNSWGNERECENALDEPIEFMTMMGEKQTRMVNLVWDLDDERDEENSRQANRTDSGLC